MTRSDAEVSVTPMADSASQMLSLAARQVEVLRQIAEMTQNTERMVIDTIKRLSEERERSFQRSVQVLAEMERLGLVDLAPVSPVLEQLSRSSSKTSK